MAFASRLTALFSLLALWMLGVVAWAEDLAPVQLDPQAAPQVAAIQPIQTDRPDFTETPFAVPRGSLQVENGALWFREDGTRTWLVPETLVRVGIGHGAELRYVVPPMLWQRGDETASGAGDMEAGFKKELGTHGGFELALMPMVVIPTGADRLSSQVVEGSLTLLWARPLTPKTEIGGNLEFEVVHADGMTFGFTPTLVLAHQFTEKFGALVEYRGNFNAQGKAGNMLHYAMTYKPTPRQQFDMRFGHAVSNDIEELLVGVGYSFRLDGLF